MRTATQSLKGLALLVLLSVLVAGCATPRPVLRLEPVTDSEVQHDYREGWQHVWRSTDDVEIELAFVEHAGRSIQFDLRVSNFGDTAIEVDPKRIFYLSLDGSDPSAMSMGDTLWATNPEQQLVQLDQREAKALSSYQNADMTDTVVSLVGLIASFSSDEEEVDSGPSWADQMEENQARYESTISTIEVQRYEWSEEALRRTTLYSGETVGGFVRFPVQYEKSFVRIVVPVGEIEVPFTFRQRAVTAP